MRRVTKQEGESWRALAQQHGFGSAEGRFVLGRFIVEDRDENGLLLCVVTPIPAGLDAEKAQIETLPVMFNRTPADEIVVPGRWWQVMFENVSADAAAPAEMRQMAATIAATTICRDVLLPADSDTVEIGIVDSQGKVARYEALPPGTRMRARLEAARVPGARGPAPTDAITGVCSGPRIRSSKGAHPIPRLTQPATPGSSPSEPST